MAVSTIDALYNGGSEKVTATSTGIDVTGTVTADGLTVARENLTDLKTWANDDVGSIDFYQAQNHPNANSYKRLLDINAGGENAGSIIRFLTQAGGSASAEAMRIDSSGNVGIGSVPSAWAGSSTALQIGSLAFEDYSVGGANVSGIYNNAFRNTSGNIVYTETDFASTYAQYNGEHIFKVAPSGSANATISFIEAMRIDSSGNVLIHRTSPATSQKSISFTVDANGTVIDCGTTYSGFDQMRFRHNGNLVGTVSVTASATAYNTSSDYRLKTDAQPMVGASARVQALNPVNFEWIASGDRVDGFLAHEAQAVVPESVTGTKDAMMDEEYEVTPAVYEDVVIEAVLDDEGNELEAERTEQNLVTEAVMGTRNVPDYQGIDQSKIVPLLTAALQEALTEIAALKARVTTLEG